MTNWIKNNKGIIGIFFLALAVRLILFSVNFSYQDFNLIDTIHGDDGYYEISQGLLAGHGFTGSPVPPFTPNPLRPPVWPLLIAFFAYIFGSYWTVLIVEIAMGSMIPVLGFYIARRFLPKRGALVVGVLLAVEPYSVLLSSILYTETSFTFFFLIFLVFLFRYIEQQSYRNAVWAGTFLGIATLIKPTVQYFPVIIPLILLYIFRKKLNYHLGRHLLAFLAVFLLIVAPWLYRNHVEFGVWGMSAQPAFNLYVYLVPTVLSIDNHTNFSTEHKNFVTKDGFNVNTINLSNSKFYKDTAISILKDHKSALIKSVLITGVTFFTHDGMLTVLQHAGYTPSVYMSKPALTALFSSPIMLARSIATYVRSPLVIVLVMRLVWIAVTVLFFIGLIRYIIEKRFDPKIITILVIILYFVLTSVIGGLGVNARYRMPITPIILTFACTGLLSLRDVILARLKKDDIA